MLPVAVARARGARAGPTRSACPAALGVRRVPRRRPGLAAAARLSPTTAPYLGSLRRQRAAPLTCGVPSTTATSLTSLGTGLPPGQHGVVGFTSRIPGTERLLDALRWDAERRPGRSGSRTRRVFDRAAVGGVEATVVSKRSFGLRADRRQPARRRVRRRRHGGGADLGAHVRAAAGAVVADLRVRRRARLRPATGSAAARGRGSTSCAMVDEFAQRLRAALPPERRPGRHRRPRHGRHRRRTSAIDVDARARAARRRRTCSAARRGSGISTARRRRRRGGGALARAAR